MRKLMIVGLGNPGSKYVGTRHNLGLDLVKDFGLRHGDDLRDSVIFFEPDTYMNRNGKAIAMKAQSEGVEPDQLLLVHDDLELSFGEIKLSNGGSAKGHNGVRSVHQELGSTEIRRLRLGIGRPKEGVAVNDFVLSRFLLEEQDDVLQMKTMAKEQLSRLINKWKEDDNS